MQHRQHSEGGANVSKLAQPGDFCPNRDCGDYGKLQSGQQQNIIKFGKTKAGRQRHKCKTYNCTFVETKGTIFYRRRTPEDEIIDTLTLIAEDSRISSLARAKGHKKRPSSIGFARQANMPRELRRCCWRNTRSNVASWTAYGLTFVTRGKKRLPRNRRDRPVLALYHDRYG